MDDPGANLFLPWRPSQGSPQQSCSFQSPWSSVCVSSPSPRAQLALLQTHQLRSAAKSEPCSSAEMLFVPWKACFPLLPNILRDYFDQCGVLSPFKRYLLMCRAHTLCVSMISGKWKISQIVLDCGEKNEGLLLNCLFFHLIAPSSVPPSSETHPTDSVTLFIKYLSFHPQTTPKWPKNGILSLSTAYSN